MVPGGNTSWNRPWNFYWRFRSRCIDQLRATTMQAPSTISTSIFPDGPDSDMASEATTKPTATAAETRAAATTHPALALSGDLYGIDSSDEPHTLQYSACTGLGWNLRQYLVPKLAPHPEQNLKVSGRKALQLWQYFMSETGVNRSRSGGVGTSTHPAVSIA